MANLRPIFVKILKYHSFISLPLLKAALLGGHWPKLDSIVENGGEKRSDSDWRLKRGREMKERYFDIILFLQKIGEKLPKNDSEEDSIIRKSKT